MSFAFNECSAIVDMHVCRLCDKAAGGAPALICVVRVRLIVVLMHAPEDSSSPNNVGFSGFVRTDTISFLERRGKTSDVIKNNK